jgi:membrane protein YqaA with SNARE-associated domain
MGPHEWGTRRTYFGEKASASDPVDSSDTVKLHPVIWFHKAAVWIMAVLKPFGIWGLGGLSFIDSGLFPVPPTFDLVLIGYVTGDHSRLVLYVFVAALGSALGSLIPYSIARAGGELFLLKRIDRKRYEQLRDRFARQEFFVIAIAAMMPTPFPLKIFEFAAGAFEVKTFPFVAGIFCGKFVRFLLISIVTVVYGATIVHTVQREFNRHAVLFLTAAGLLVVLFAIYVTRKLFARRETTFPVEGSPSDADLN